jgi:hypothetical protein
LGGGVEALGGFVGVVRTLGDFVEQGEEGFEVGSHGDYSVI